MTAPEIRWDFSSPPQIVWGQPQLSPAALVNGVMIVVSDAVLTGEFVWNTAICPKELVRRSMGSGTFGAPLGPRRKLSDTLVQSLAIAGGGLMISYMMAKGLLK